MHDNTVVGGQIYFGGLDSLCHNNHIILDTIPALASGQVSVIPYTVGGTFAAGTYYWTVTGWNQILAGNNTAITGTTNSTTAVTALSQTLPIGAVYAVTGSGVPANATLTITAASTGTLSIAATTSLSNTPLTLYGETTSSAEVTCAVVHNGSVVVNWDPMPGVNGYWINRATSTGGETTGTVRAGFITGATTTTFTDTGAATTIGTWGVGAAPTTGGQTVTATTTTSSTAVTAIGTTLTAGNVYTVSMTGIPPGTTMVVLAGGVTGTLSAASTAGQAGGSLVLGLQVNPPVNTTKQVAIDGIDVGVTGSQGCTGSIHHNTIVGGNFGVKIFVATNLLVEGNWMRAQYKGGIYNGSNLNTDLIYKSNYILVDQLSLTAVYAGITSQGTDEVQANTIDMTNATVTTYGILMSNSTVGQMVVNDNRCIGGSQAVIQVSASVSGARVSNNATGHYTNDSGTGTIKYGNTYGTGDPVSGQAVLAAGTKTVTALDLRAGDTILLSVQVTGGTVGFLSVGTVTSGPGGSFVINSSSGTDTSTVAWQIIH